MVQSKRTVKKDQMEDFQAQFEKKGSRVDPEDESFESLITIAQKGQKTSAGSKKQLLEKAEIDKLFKRRVDEIQSEVSKKEMQEKGMERPVQKDGLIKFENYESKLEMMDTALFLFGMKLYRQEGSVEFFDADFANTLQVSSQLFENKTLGECCVVVNEVLKTGGFSGRPLMIGTLKDIDDFDLTQILVRKDGKISLRFNGFEQALEAH
jgi:hypothetical protein